MDTVASKYFHFRVERRSGWMRRHKLGTSALLLFTALVALRLALPHFLKTYVERTINKIPEYRCTVGDIDVALFRGAYKIKNFDLKKISANVAVPFFRADDADLSIQWGALFEGKLVGEINLTHPQLNFTAANAKKNNQMGIDSEWLDAVKDLFPLRINHFEVNQGEIHYRDFESNPKVDIKIVDAHVVANNLSNTRSPTNALEASINANAKVENTAALKVRSKVKPSEKTPTFVLEASLEKLPIVKVNDFLKAYANFDAQAGTLSVYSKMQANDGNLSGSVKPLVRDLEVLDLNKDSDNPLNLAWQSVVATVAEIFTNHRHDQIGIEVPFEGKFDSPETDAWSAVLSMFSNAFIRALKPGLDGELEFKRRNEKLKD